MKNYINLGEKKIDVKQFISKMKNYDIELTRKDILNVIGSAKENNPEVVSSIVNAVSSVYHINMAC